MRDEALRVRLCVGEHGKDAVAVNDLYVVLPEAITPAERAPKRRHFTIAAYSGAVVDFVAGLAELQLEEAELPLVYVADGLALLFEHDAIS